MQQIEAMISMCCMEPVAAVVEGFSAVEAVMIGVRDKVSDAVAFELFALSLKSSTPRLCKSLCLPSLVFVK